MGFAPCFVVRCPCNLTLLVGEFLRRAEVVALVVGNALDRLRLGLVAPDGVVVNVVACLAVDHGFVVGCGQQLNRAFASCLQHGNEAVGLVDVVDGLTGVKRGFDLACGLVDVAACAVGALPCKGVAVPAVQGDAEVFGVDEFAALAVFVATACATGDVDDRLAVFDHAAAKGVVGVVGLYVVAGALHHAVEVIPFERGDLAVVGAFDHVAAFVILVVCADVLFEQVVQDDVGFGGVLMNAWFVINRVVL